MSNTAPPSSIYDFSARTITGDTRSLGDYRGRALLIVNVASQCGLTPAQIAAIDSGNARALFGDRI